MQGQRCWERPISSAATADFRLPPHAQARCWSAPSASSTAPAPSGRWEHCAARRLLEHSCPQGSHVVCTLATNFVPPRASICCCAPVHNRPPSPSTCPPQSHYFYCELPQQFDMVIHMDSTAGGCSVRNICCSGRFHYAAADVDAPVSIVQSQLSRSRRCVDTCCTALVLWSAALRRLLPYAAKAFKEACPRRFRSSLHMSAGSAAPSGEDGAVGNRLAGSGGHARGGLGRHSPTLNVAWVSQLLRTQTLVPTALHLLQLSPSCTQPVCLTLACPLLADLSVWRVSSRDGCPLKSARRRGKGQCCDAGGMAAPRT